MNKDIQALSPLRGQRAAWRGVEWLKLYNLGELSAGVEPRGAAWSGLNCIMWGRASVRAVEPRRGVKRLKLDNVGKLCAGVEPLRGVVRLKLLRLGGAPPQGHVEPRRGVVGVI